MDKYSYYYETKDGGLYGPYRTATAIKSAMQTRYGSRKYAEEGITIKRGKVVLEENWSEFWIKK